jgi:hypothetical protein
VRHLPLATALVGISLLGALARGDEPTGVVVRHLGGRPARVQIALGNALPCDSSENRIVFDQVVGPGGSRSFTVPDTCVCARHTLGDWATEFGTSSRVCGGARCTGAGRGRVCVPDPSQPIRVDVSN